MAGHDQLFKDILRGFFPEFLGLVAPGAAAESLAGEATFLDGETFTDTPRGEQRQLDLLARCPGRSGDSRVVLIHVEIERRFRSSMDERMWRYYLQLVLRHGRKVLPIALFLKGGAPGITRRRWRERVADLTVSRFEYLAFGLSRSPAPVYLQRPETLVAGLAALMHRGTWDRPRQRLECLKRISQAPVDDARRFLLFNLVETYLDLKGAEVDRYAELMRSTENRAVRTMEMTWADRMEARGELQGARQILVGLLEKRFGAPRSFLERRLEELESLDDLQRLSERLLEAKTLEELGLA